MFTITRDGETTTSDTLPTDMPDQAKRMLSILGVTFYGGGAVQVTNEAHAFWLAEVESESDPAEQDPAEAEPELTVTIDGINYPAQLMFEGAVVATVNTPAGLAVVTVDELNRWNPNRVCPIHGADCEAWS